MGIRFILTNSLSTKELSLEQEKYEQLIKCRSQLTHALYIEEKYDILLSNHIAIEKHIINNTIDRVFYNKNSYSNSHEFRLSLNKMFGNLLSSIKAYQDQILGDVEKILSDDPNAKDICKRLFSIQYDSFFEYRFMEALRNHSQHGGQPVHEHSFRAKHIGNADQSRNEFATLVSSLKSTLIENKGFKKAILADSDDKTDLIKYSRQYIQCINICHLQIREMISSEIKIARREIETILSEFANLEPKKQGNTYLTKIDSEGNEIDKNISLFLDYDNERLDLIKKNQKLRNLNMACFSSTSYSNTLSNKV